MQAPSSSTITLLVLLPLIGWRVYSRFRRMIGRQRLSKYRPWIQLTIFPILIILLCLAARSHPERLLWLACALVAGIPLGIFGLRHTTFEPTKGGLFYTPNSHLGIALSTLFLLRIAYRIVEVYILAPDTPRDMHEFGGNPLTLMVFGTLASYYITYAIGLANWRRKVLAAKRLRDSRNGDA